MKEKFVHTTKMRDNTKFVYPSELEQKANFVYIKLGETVALNI